MLRHIILRFSVQRCPHRLPHKIHSFHSNSCLEMPRKFSNPNFPSAAIAGKYKIVSDDSFSVIENTADETYSQEIEFDNDEFDGVNLTRGKTGVFDIEDMIELLQRENSKDIFVATVPREINYVDYIVIVTARSTRHILALAEFTRKVYKQKCHKNDLIPKIEGKSSTEWMALDLGNIALHIFSEKTRKVYDLETLWSVGHEYDKQMENKSDVVEIFENYSLYLKDLKPLT